jgi:hypothetical protein
MSQQNVGFVRGLCPAPEVAYAQHLRDDSLWAAWTEAAAPYLHLDLDTPGTNCGIRSRL